MGLLSFPLDTLNKGWNAFRELLTAPSVEERLKDHQRRLSTIEQRFVELQDMLDSIKSEVNKAKENIQDLRVEDVKIREESRTEVGILRATLQLILGQIQKRRNEVRDDTNYSELERGYVVNMLNGLSARIAGSNNSLNGVERRLEAAG